MSDYLDVMGCQFLKEDLKQYLSYHTFSLDEMKEFVIKFLS